jgi:hypothetical protein
VIVAIVSAEHQLHPMSAYGDIKRIQSSGPLVSTLWILDKRPLGAVDTSDVEYITVHHLTLKAAREHPGLLEYLGAVFAKEVEDGMTYPQEGDMPQATFEAYFFAADVFLGIVGKPAASHGSLGTATGNLADGSSNNAPGLIEERAGRSWEDCVAGYFYVSILGRSSMYSTGVVLAIAFPLHCTTPLRNHLFLIARHSLLTPSLHTILE